MSEKVKLTPELLRELQLKELDTLEFFRDFCQKNNLTFYLCGGCCIGSLRTGGFVPWDDDIDVLMPRPDYERLTVLWKEQNPSNRFLLLKTDDEIFTGNIFVTITDTNYTMIKDNQKDVDIPHGLVLDVFPIDGCPKGKIKRYFQYFWTMIYSLFLAQVVPENHGGLLSLGSKALLKIFRKKKTRNKIWRFAEKKMTKYSFETSEYVTELCAGPHFMTYKYPKRIYEGTAEVEFEGLKMPVMKGYDEYLTIVFGDYMKEPPKEKQVPHHDIAYLDLNTPCIKQEGSA